MNNETLPSAMVIVLTVACIAIVIIGLRKALQRSSRTLDQQKSTFIKSVSAMLLWVIVLGVLALLGFFRDLTSLPPRPVFIFPFAVVVALSLTFSKGTKELLMKTPVQWLVYVQAFRIFVELILWQGYLRGILPVQMTFEGYNYDILSGIFALPAGWMMSRNKTSARVIGIFYNLMGIALLLNILIIAVLSMPTPIRYFMNEPSNLIVGEFPFIYIPGVFVVLAIFMHIFSLRQLSVQKRISQV